MWAYQAIVGTLALALLVNMIRCKHPVRQFLGVFVILPFLLRLLLIK